MVKKTKECRTRRRSRRPRRPRRSVNKMAGVPYFSHIKSDYSIPKKITIKKKTGVIRKLINKNKKVDRRQEREMEEMLRTLHELERSKRITKNKFI